MNKCCLVGNLTRDPKTTTTGSGITVCRFSIAINRTFKNASGENEADFIDIVAWRGLGDNCGKYLSKGSKVSVVGSIRTRNYEKDGQKIYSTEIEAEDVQFLTPRGNNNDGGSEREFSGGSRGSSGGSSGGAKKQASSEMKPIDDEGLPF